MENVPSDKITVLLNCLQERYKAIHIIRARVEQTCTWAIGLLVVAAGFFIDRNISLSWHQKLYTTVSLLLVFAVLKFFFFKDLEKGFKSQMRVAAHIENQLGLYQENNYGTNPVYPLSWLKAGQEKCEGRFFRSSYLLLYTGFLILIGAIILA
jgi:hypothetical protein